jgi:hypothetical protein
MSKILENEKHRTLGRQVDIAHRPLLLEIQIFQFCKNVHLLYAN